MSELDEEKKQFTSQVRDEFIEMINQQVKLEEKSRQYKLIFQLAEKYRQGDAKSIHEFIDSEKKIAEKDKNSVRTQITNQRQANDSINSRKNFIPMLELEYCILTAENLPKSLFPEINTNDQIVTEKININFSQEQSDIDAIFNTSFQSNVINLSDIKDSELKSISHAHVIIASLSFYPQNWPTFLDKFKAIYRTSASKRYSFLHFITIWFEMRPKHFLKMFPYLIDLIEDCDDGDLLIKHLKIIFDYSKRNMYFRFLPLDSVPHSFKLNYIQTSDYHKLISGNDVTTMQNSFKSNMLKRFDFTNSKFCSEVKGDKNNSNEKPTNNTNKGKNKNKGNNPTARSNITQNTNQTNNSNDNSTANEEKKDDYPQQPNLQDFVDAILILITTIQNALSFDCFIPQTTIDKNILIEEEEEENETIYDQMNSIKLEETKHLKYLFTESEFNFWKEKIKSIEVAHQGIQKLIRIFDGFSNWIVEVLNNQKAENDAVFKIILDNYKTLYKAVKDIDPDIAKDFLKINFEEVKKDIMEALKNQNLLKEFSDVVNDTNTQNTLTKNQQQEKNDQSDIISRFLCKDQIQYKMGHKIIAESESKYGQLLDITINILSLLKKKPTLAKKVRMDGYSYEIFCKNEESSNHNDKTQQYVDPWAIRIIFYNFSRFIFDPKYKNLNFKYEV